MEVCFSPHCRHVHVLLHSLAWCFMPVQLKHKHLSLKIFQRCFTSLTLFALSWFVIFGITVYTRFRCGRCLKGLIFLWVRSTSSTGFFRVTPLTKGLHKLRVIPLLPLVIQTNKICSDIRELIKGTMHKPSNLVKLSQCFQCLDLTCKCLIEFVHFAWISSLNLG